MKKLLTAITMLLLVTTMQAKELEIMYKFSCNNYTCSQDYAGTFIEMKYKEGWRVKVVSIYNYGGIVVMTREVK